ncbi:MAG: DUF4340 domain-containing protein [Gemmatimonadota bacterium]|nr:DUF4340 domain-containing protein [Gemmatimonadota bacterium]
MSWKSILVLLLLCAGLGVYLFIEFSQVDKGPEKDTKLYLMPIDPEDVVDMEVVFLDTTYVLHREEFEWVLSEPFVNAPADTFTVNSLLRTLSRIVIRQSIHVDSINLSQIALNKPVLSFKLHMESGDTLGVKFGALNPDTESIYARRGDENMVRLINRMHGPTLAAHGFMLRSKGLTDRRPYDFVSLRYTFSPRLPDVTAACDPGTGDWWIGEPGGGDRLLADKRVILDLLWSLYRNKVREFRPDGVVKAGETGLSRPVRTLRLEAENGDATVIRLGSEKSGMDYLRWAESSIYPDDILLVDSSCVLLLDRLKTENLQNLQMTTFNLDEVNRIEILSPTDTIDIVAESDTLWKIVKPDQAACRTWQIERLLTHADTMQAAGILAPVAREGRGFDHPQLTLRLYNGPRVVERVLVGDYAGDRKIYMRDDLRNMDFLATETELERLNFTYEDLADVLVRHVVR